MKQSIIVTGLGSASFENCVRAVLEMQTKLSSALPPDSLQEWRPTTSEGHLCLEFSNRYFATAADGDHLNTIGLPSEVDPFGLLAEAVPSGRYTEDNQVLYYDRIISDNR